jgi:hypothetical protein
MPLDIINEEILAIKRSLSDAFNNDVRRIAEDSRSRETNAVHLQSARMTSEAPIASKRTIAPPSTAQH